MKRVPLSSCCLLDILKSIEELFTGILFQMGMWHLKLLIETGTNILLLSSCQWKKKVDFCQLVLFFMLHYLITHSIEIRLIFCHFSCAFIWWHTSVPYMSTCKLFILTCDLFMSTCNMIMLSWDSFILSWNIIMLQVEC